MKKKMTLAQDLRLLGVPLEENLVPVYGIPSSYLATDDKELLSLVVDLEDVLIRYRDTAPEYIGLAICIKVPMQLQRLSVSINTLHKTYSLINALRREIESVLKAHGCTLGEPWVDGNGDYIIPFDGLVKTAVSNRPANRTIPADMAEDLAPSEQMRSQNHDQAHGLKDGKGAVLVYRFSSTGGKVIVSGETYPIRGYFKAKGFRWSADDEAWVINYDEKLVKAVFDELKANNYVVVAKAGSKEVPGFPFQDITPKKGVTPLIPDGGGARIIYAKGGPYGAPLVRLRGTGTSKLRDYMKSKTFKYNADAYAWETYMDSDEFLGILKELKAHNYSVFPKEKMDDRYVFAEFPRATK